MSEQHGYWFQSDTSETVCQTILVSGPSSLTNELIIIIIVCNLKTSELVKVGIDWLSDLILSIFPNIRIFFRIIWANSRWSKLIFKLLRLLLYLLLHYHNYNLHFEDIIMCDIRNHQELLGLIFSIFLLTILINSSHQSVVSIDVPDWSDWLDIQITANQHWRTKGLKFSWLKICKNSI